MLYVVFRSIAGSPARKVMLRMTQKMEEFKMANVEFLDSEIVQLYADGEEYCELRIRFENLPIFLAGKCTWYGDHAKFIFFNLANYT